MNHHVVDLDVPPQSIVLMGQPAALRAVRSAKQDDGSHLAAPRIEPRLDPVVATAPSGRTVALQVIMAADGTGLHGTVYLQTGFFDVKSTPGGLDPTGCRAWEIGGRPVAFQIAFALPGSAFENVAPFSYDLSLDDPAHFLRHGHHHPDEEDLAQLLEEAQGVFDTFLATTPDLVRDAQEALARLRVGILRRQADLVAARAEELRRDADDLEAGLPAPAASPRA